MSWRVHDLSLPVGAGVEHPAMPGLVADPGLRIGVLRAHDAPEGDGQVIRTLSARLHVGTHVDAPEHYVPGGRQVADVPVETYVGPAWVADLGEVARDAPIDARMLDHAAGDRLERGGRLLVKTGWNARFGRPDWREGSPYLTVDAVEWLADRSPALVGVDFAHAKDPPGSPRRYYLSHRLCTAGVVVLANLRLDHVPVDRGLLVAAPIALLGVEAAPVRALLLEV